MAKDKLDYIQEVAQADEAELKATVSQAEKDRTIQEPLSVDDGGGSLTVDGAVSAEVVQDTAADLNCTNTPDGTTAQPVIQKAGVRGIWPAANAERVNLRGVKDGVGSIFVYTVPANKKLFIAGMNYNTRNNIAQITKMQLHVLDAGDNFKYDICCHLYAIAGHQNTPSTFIPALEVDAGWYIIFTNDNANTYTWLNLFCWLEDA